MHFFAPVLIDIFRLEIWIKWFPDLETALHIDIYSYPLVTTSLPNTKEKQKNSESFVEFRRVALNRTFHVQSSRGGEILAIRYSSFHKIDPENPALRAQSPLNIRSLPGLFLLFLTNPRTPPSESIFENPVGLASHAHAHEKRYSTGSLGSAAYELDRSF